MFLRALFVVLLLLPAVARADDYAKPDWPSLTRTMVRFNAIDLSDPAILDEYAIVTECDLYKAFYSNDFKWQQVRQAVLQAARNDIATFPTAYYYDTKLQLDRYDFGANLFRFTDKSTIRNVNAFTIYSVAGTGCGGAHIKILPRTFRVVIGVPVTMDGIPLGEKDAQTLLGNMDKDGNISRIVYARFNLRITYIDPMRKMPGGQGEADIYHQSNAPDNESVRLDAHLDSIDFYEDPQMQKLIYEAQM
ncbi:MAG: DUF4852 domain-containing protein [Alphaproteobacteria bacterium]|nr:DUF4852 domain-containing protein [Alphaproteobacteria bacterium]